MQSKLSKMQKEIIKIIYQNTCKVDGKNDSLFFKKTYRLELTQKLAEKLNTNQKSQSFKSSLSKSLKSLKKRDLIFTDEIRCIKCVNLTEDGIKTTMELLGKKPIKEETDEDDVAWDI